WLDNLDYLSSTPYSVPGCRTTPVLARSNWNRANCSNSPADRILFSSHKMIHIRQLQGPRASTLDVKWQVGPLPLDRWRLALIQNGDQAPSPLSKLPTVPYL